MSLAISQFFLYLAAIFIINSLVQPILRRFRIADFLSHVITGVLIAAAIWLSGATAEFSSPDESRQSFKVTTETVSYLQKQLGDSIANARVSQWENRRFASRQAFRDSLQTIIGSEKKDLLSFTLPAAAPPPAQPFDVLLEFLIFAGLIIYLMQIGVNFNPRFLQLHQDRIFLLHVSIVVIISVVVLFSGGYFLIFDLHIVPSFLWTIAFLSINIGSLISVVFPLKLPLKSPFSRLIQVSVLLDILAIAGYGWIVLAKNYQHDFEAQLKADAGYWIVLMIFTAVMPMHRQIRGMIKYLQNWLGDFSILLRLGFILLFIYAGSRIHFPVLILGMGAGFLFRVLMQSEDLEFRRRFFSGASFLYIIPFVEIGRLFFRPGIFLTETWLSAAWMLAIFIVLSLLAALVWFTQEGYPKIIAVGSFPRGEIAVLIWWLFYKADFITTNVFLSGVLAVILSTFAGVIIARIVFAKSAESGRKLKI